MPTPPPIPDEPFERPSKTRLKKQSHELQSLGEALAELPDARLAALELPEILRDAIEQYRRTRSHEGRRRQMQYVGKLMRGADEDALREAVALATIGSARAALALHEAERWRAEMIAGDDALTRWLAAHPDTDSQQLRSLVRAARKEKLEPGERHGRAYRDLFKLVKEQMLDMPAADDSAPADPSHDD